MSNAVNPSLQDKLLIEVCALAIIRRSCAERIPRLNLVTYGTFVRTQLKSLFIVAEGTSSHRCEGYCNDIQWTQLEPIQSVYKHSACPSRGQR